MKKHKKVSTVKSVLLCAGLVLCGICAPAQTNDAHAAGHSGWVKENGSWYYNNTDGSRSSGWLKDNGTWYYLKSGKMLTGWVKDQNNWYYMRNDGTMAKGWLLKNGTWYYLRNSGEMATGWLKISDKWYYFKQDGSMAANCTVDGWELGADGAMLEGSQSSGSTNSSNNNGNNTSSNSSWNSSSSNSGSSDSYVSDASQTSYSWVLNTKTHKIHYPSCKDVKRIKAQNLGYSHESEAALIAQGYTTCGHCH